MSRRGRGLLVGLLAALASCDRLGSKSVDVTPITEEAEGLSKSEADLLGERGVLQRERSKLVEQRAELVEKRKSAGSTGQSLEDEERKLLEREQALVSKESTVNKRLEELLTSRAQLLSRATQAVAVAPGADPLERAARREASVAQREKDLARRESELAARERDIADREARQSRREREGCGAEPAPRLELPKGSRGSAKEIEKLYKQALRVMQSRGLLATDLPPAAARAWGDAKDAMRRSDWGRAGASVAAFAEAVQSIQVDRGFIAGKMARLSASLKGRRIADDRRRQFDGLFEEATADYSDGNFDRANSKINQLVATMGR